MYGMESFDWSSNIHVWNLSRNLWYAYPFIHETSDTRIVLYTKLLIRVCILTWNFSYVEPLALFVHFGQPYLLVLWAMASPNRGRLIWQDCSSHVQYYFTYEDVIKRKHFPRYWQFVWGIHRSPVNSPHKGQWLGALMFSLICVWTNGWVNNREAGDSRRYRAHCDVTIMIYKRFGASLKTTGVVYKHLEPTLKIVLIIKSR